MTIFVEIVYVLITVILILVVLLQAGRGGGMGTALGGGASQSVFGGGGGADFLAKLTQGLAAGFMLCAVYLAYASAHTGSDRLKDKSQALKGEEFLADEGEEVNYERVGPNPLVLPPSDAEEKEIEAEPEEAVEEEAPVEEAPVEEAPVEEAPVEEPPVEEPPEG